ncbi:MAG: thiamine-phosphate kinase [Bacteroidetes bacterium]|nr:MAG: thiamine-phosphate kinase [Bacteroidota bacterium]
MFEDRSDKRTELSTLGEFGLIDYLTKDIELKQKSSIYGIGDDAAVIDTDNKKLLISTDLLTEGVHFDLSFMPLKHLGYKAVVVNLSDIAAMNAIPTQITVSLGISNRFSLEAINEIYNGIKLACKNYNVDLVGGDTTSTTAGLVISITVLGLADEDDIVYRNGAKENNLVCVSGDLGGSYAGLMVLEQEKTVFTANPDMQPQLGGNDYILERHLKPEARIDIVNTLTELKVKPTAMMDISDGLASEIKHICKQSNVGANLYEDKIPIDQQTWDTARKFKMDPTTYAMNGGEDYELLFTIDAEDYDKIKGHAGISVIGHITASSAGVNLITKNNVSVPIEAQGWDGLKDKG